MYNRHAFLREEHTPTLCVPIKWAFWHDKGTSPSLVSPFRVCGSNSISPPAEQRDQCPIEEDVHQQQQIDVDRQTNQQNIDRHDQQLQHHNQHKAHDMEQPAANAKW